MNWGRTFFDVDLFTGVSRRTKSFRYSERWPGPAYFLRNLWRRDMLQLTSQLSIMVKRNAPLSAGLDRALSDGPSLKLTQAMIALRDDLALGLPLSESMRRRPRFYPGWYVDLVAAGESTGALAPALESARAYLAQAIPFKRRIGRWLVYVGFVLFCQLTIAFFLFRYVLPEYGEILTDFNAELPREFEFVHQLADRIRLFDVGGAIVLAFFIWIVATVSHAFLRHRTLRGRRLLRDIFARLPFVTNVTGRMELANICAVLKCLTAARVPLNETLQDCSALDINARYRAALHRIRQRVEQGESFANALRQEQDFPRSFKTLLALGEASGRLPDAAAHLQAMYQQQSISRARILSDVLGPIGVLLLGLFSFAIYSGFFSVVLAVTEAILDSLY